MGRRGKTRFVVGFLAPASLVYGLFVVWPFVQAVQGSLYRWSGLSSNRQYVGLENYRRLVADKVFWTSLGHNLWLLAVAGTLTMVASLLVAQACLNRGRLAGALKSVYLFPQVVSLVAVAVLWQFILNPQGLLNGSLRAVGLGNLAKTWLGDPQWALAAVGLVFVWTATGFYALLFGAGITAIPAEIFEAAEIDGSLGLHRFRKVTWPLLWSVRRVAMVYLAINVTGVFALVFLMTRGGPDRRSEVVLTYLYERAFQDSEFGYSTALSVGGFALTLALSLLVLWLTRSDPTEGRQRRVAGR